jgi:two-component system cell cycle sensor histidine kinase/response regulator CckA
MIEPGEYVILSVRDSGSGISEGDINKIFEPYYSKKKMGRSGSGLGLSVVYGIVKDHGAYYDIQSKLGEGTEFSLYFPVAVEDVQAGERADSAMSGTERVLVVDDVAEQREIASEFLTCLGYSVTTVASGREAIEHLRDNRADIILMDMILETEPDGLDTYRKILELHPRQKALIISGYSATERVEEMQRLGAGAYIKKPFSLDTIGNAIREELKR